jgi:ubiquinone/menaquinone biosynthesis C-methylase UbiE
MTEKFTGERFIPGQGGVQIAAEHLHRYLLASEFVSGLRVLDMGCGAGYGSSLLQNCSSYLGIDVSESSVESATKSFGSQTVNFRVGDCQHLDLPDQSFDVVVCFEMLEHVENPDLIVREAKRLLTNNGIFISSTPDKDEYNRFLTEPNEFHVHEMTKDQYERLLSTYFPVNDLVGQFYVQTSIIRPTTGLQNLATVYQSPRVEWLEPLNEPIYWIGISSDEPQHSGGSSILPSGGTRDLEGELVKVMRQLGIYEAELKKIQDHFESNERN